MKTIHLILILTVLTFIFGDRSLNKFSVLKQIDINVLAKNVRDDQKLFSGPLSTDYFSAKYISDKNPTSVHLDFYEQITVGGISFFFPGNGNLETDSSYVPSDFDIYFKRAGSDWILVDQKRHYGKSSYLLDLKKNLDLEGIKIVLLKSGHENGEVRLSDLKIFTKTTVGLTEYLSWLASSNVKSFWSYLIYSLLFFLIIIIPGAGFLSLFTREYFFFGPIVSMFVLASSTLGYIVFGNNIFLLLYLPYLVIGIVLFFRKKIYRKIGGNKLLLFLILIFILATSLLQASRDTLFNLNYIETFLDKLDFIPMNSYLGYHADNTMPWGIARSILHQVSPFSESALRYRLGQPARSVFDRIPTLSLMVVPILSFFGESHFIFQRFLNVLVSFYYLAVYWMIGQFFSEKVTRLTVLLVLLSVPLSLTTWNAELNIKYVSMFPLILAAGFLAKKRKTPLWLVSCLLTFSVLIHPMAVLFAPAFIIVLWLKTKSLSRTIYNSITICLPAVTLLILWFVISDLIKRFSGSIPRPSLFLDSIYIYSRAGSLSWTTKAANVINVFIPDYQNRINPNFLMGGHLRSFFRNSIIGSLSPLFVYYLFFRTKIATLARHLSAVALGAVPQVTIWILPLSYDAGSFSFFFPFTIPFLLALVIHNLYRKNPRIRFAYVVSFIVFMGLSFYVGSTAFQDLRHWDIAITVYSVILWAVFSLISIIILKAQEKT